jgi:hypothetical protein
VKIESPSAGAKKAWFAEGRRHLPLLSFTVHFYFLIRAELSRNDYFFSFSTDNKYAGGTCGFKNPSGKVPWYVSSLLISGGRDWDPKTNPDDNKENKTHF